MDDRDEPWTPPRPEAPFNALPPVIAALALLIAGVELVLSAADRGLAGGARAVGWRLELIERFGVFGSVLDQMAERGAFPPEHLLRLLAFPFVHAGFVHALFAVVFLLAMGKFAGEVFAGWKLAVLFFLSSVFGALVWWLATGDPAPLIGAYPGAYGLIGAFTFILWAGLSLRGEKRAQAFRLILFLVGIQILFFGLFGGTLAFVAEIAGFAAGFALSFVLAPGGWAALRAKLRNR